MVPRTQAARHFARTLAAWTEGSTLWIGKQKGEGVVAQGAELGHVQGWSVGSHGEGLRLRDPHGRMIFSFGILYFSFIQMLAAITCAGLSEPHPRTGVGSAP